MERAKEAPSLTTLLLLLLTMALGSYAIATDNIQPAQDGDGRIAWPHESVHYFLRRNPSGYRTTLAMEEEHNPKIRDYWMKNASFAEVVRRRDDVDLPSRHVGGVVYDGSFEIDLPEGMQFPEGVKSIDIDFSHCPTDHVKLARRRDREAIQYEEDQQAAQEKEEYLNMMENYERHHPRFHICTPDTESETAVNQRRRLEYFGPMEHLPAQRVATLLNKKLNGDDQLKIGESVMNFTTQLVGGLLESSNTSRYGSKGPLIEIAKSVQIPARLFNRQKRYPKSIFQWYSSREGKGTAAATLEGITTSQHKMQNDNIWKEQYSESHINLPWGGNLTNVDPGDSVMFAESDYCPGVDRPGFVFHGERKIEDEKDITLLDSLIGQQTEQFVHHSLQWQAVYSSLSLVRNPENPNTFLVRIVEAAVPSHDTDTLQIGLTQSSLEDKKMFHSAVFPNQSLAIFHSPKQFHLASKIIRTSEWKIPKKLSQALSQELDRANIVGPDEVTESLKANNFLRVETASELGVSKFKHQLSSLVVSSPIIPIRAPANTWLISSVSRSISAGGLHRQMVYRVQGSLPKIMLNKFQSSCDLLLSQRLEKTAYFDLDELREVERTGAMSLVAFTKHIDVELPSSSSAQQQILLGQRLNSEKNAFQNDREAAKLDGFSKFAVESFNASRSSDFHADGENFLLHAEMSFPVHFRYRLADDARSAEDTESVQRYASVYIPDPKFFIQCGKDSDWIPMITRRTGWPVSMNSWVPKYHEKVLSPKQIINTTSTVDSPIHPFMLNRKVKPLLSVFRVPVGTESDFYLVTIATCSVAIIGAVAIAYVAVSKTWIRKPKKD